MTQTTTMLPLTEALHQAVQKDNIDEACGLLQTSLGVTDGGVAGVCFSDVAVHPEEDGIDWAALDVLTRHRRLCDYIKTELNFMPEPRDVCLELAGFEPYHTGGGCRALARHIPLASSTRTHSSTLSRNALAPRPRPTIVMAWSTRSSAAVSWKNKRSTRKLSRSFAPRANK